MKILVTGGAGYIGSHTVKDLLKHGYEVVIVDNFSSGHPELVCGGQVIQADLRNKEQIADIFRQHKIDAVLHFAALIQVGESYQDPQKYYLHNLLTSLNLLETMLRHQVKQFIFSSSAAVYGAPQKIPIEENHPLNPVNPYGTTKFMVEKILADYSRAYGLRYVSLRYFNAAGADPEGELGELHSPETHLIPNILLHLLGKNPDFQVFGHDFPTPDGTAIRDYIHVTDLARAHVLALERLLAGSDSQVLNLGSSRGYSVLEVIKEAEKITGRKVNIKFGPKRLGDVPVLLASSRLAEDWLGWERKYSDLETIIRTAWEWHQKH
ncbi:MAG: UDP-glucose 4-epimerase GalE [Candidatus Aminicenantes bacterium]|nr:UDP-glucose 4-epimerase GalE [Candidatus Aminicenantes bacterium]